MAEGKKFDAGKLEHHLLSSAAEAGLIKILMFGKEKYGAFNWANGLKFSRVYDALQRHIKDEWWAGHDLDPETQMNHVYHAFCNLMFLAHFISFPEKYKDFDDRPSKDNE